MHLVTWILVIGFFDEQVTGDLKAARCLLDPQNIKIVASLISPIYKLDGGFKHFLFSPLLGEDIQFDKYFSDGLVQPPTR